MGRTTYQEFVGSNQTIVEGGRKIHSHDVTLPQDDQQVSMLAF